MSIRLPRLLRISDRHLFRPTLRRRTKWHSLAAVGAAPLAGSTPSVPLHQVLPDACPAQPPRDVVDDGAPRCRGGVCCGRVNGCVRRIPNLESRWLSSKDAADAPCWSDVRRGDCRGPARTQCLNARRTWPRPDCVAPHDRLIDRFLTPVVHRTLCGETHPPPCREGTIVCARLVTGGAQTGTSRIDPPAVIASDRGERPL